MPVACDVHKVAMSAPDDISGIEGLIDEGRLDPGAVVAILGKTEGNGCVNDFTRALATRALADLFARHLGIAPPEFLHRASVVISGGTEGVISPHVAIFTRAPTSAPATGGAARLAIGVAQTRDYLPEEIGTPVQVREVRDAVRRAVAEAGITDVRDVHFVQTKCPLLTTERIAQARARGKGPATADTYRSMALSRGASALGVGCAVDRLEVTEAERLLGDMDIYSSVASTSSGVEVLHDVVLVLGNSPENAGGLVIGHGVMCDALDGDAVRRAMGLPAGAGLPGGRIRHLLAKAEAAPDGAVRGRRHTMLTDSDIPATRMARAVVGAVLAAQTGDPMLYVSGGAEHQGPPGGGPVAVIWEEA